MDCCKRIYSDSLLRSESKIVLDCETKIEHISLTFKTQKDRAHAINTELKKANGIYWYLIKSINKKQAIKPEISAELNIQTTSQYR